VFALDPELVLARYVAGVVTDLEGGDDYGADGPGFGGGLGVGDGSEGQEQATANAEDAECAA